MMETVRDIMATHGHVPALGKDQHGNDVYTVDHNGTVFEMNCYEGVYIWTVVHREGTRRTLVGAGMSTETSTAQRAFSAWADALPGVYTAFVSRRGAPAGFLGNTWEDVSV